MEDRARAFQLAAGESRHGLSRVFRDCCLFEGELQKIVALAVLAPIVASQGGNATTQTMTVAVRALATRDVSNSNAWRVITQDLWSALEDGIAFAIITGVASYVWFRVEGWGW